MSISSNLVYSQAIQEWTNRVNPPETSTDEGSFVLSDNLGNVIVAGSIENSFNNLDFCILKYNSSGKIEWQNTYNSHRNGNDFLTAISMDRSGNIYVTGSSEDSLYNTDYLTIKYNRFGSELWVSEYNGLMNGDDYPQAIALDSIGNVYVTGHSLGNFGNRNLLTIKYDNFGHAIWIRHFANQNLRTEGKQLAVTRFGYLYVSGLIAKSGTSEDFLVVKCDSSGNEIWNRNFDGLAHSGDYCRHMTIDDLENVYLGGYTYNTSADYTTIKYDPLGNLLWVKLYDGAGSSDVIRDIILDRANNVYVTGSSIGAGTGYDYVTIKYDTEGNQKWLSKYTPGNGFGYSISLDQLGNTYVTGRADGFGTGDDYVTLKYDTIGMQLWSIRYDYSGVFDDYANDLAIDQYANVYVVGNSNRDILTIKYSQLTQINSTSSFPQSNFLLFQNYPNPFNPRTIIKYICSISKNVSLKTYDIRGNEISILVNEKKQPGSYEVEFTGDLLPSGIYFYKLEVDGNIIDTKKMVLLK